MKQFINILKFEYGTYLKNKAFIIITILMMLIVGVGLTVPRIIDMVENKKGDTNVGDTDVDDTELPIVAFVDNFSTDIQASLTLFQEKLPDKEIVLVDIDESEIKKSVEEGKYESAVVVTGAKNYKYIVNDIKMYDTTRDSIKEIMIYKYRVDTMQSLGLSMDQTNDLLNVEIQGEVVQSGKDQFMNFIYTYVMVFALYIVIMLYGQLVASGVASEKSSRAMELLITSAKPSSLMFGKVIGIGLAGLTQMVLIISSGVISFILNKDFIDGSGMLSQVLDIPASTLVYMLIFFVLGYFIYAFMYAALASLASRVEDMTTLVMPVTLIFVVMFMVTMMSMSSGNVDSTLMKVCSFLPITSPMAMFVRITMGNVKFFEIIISIVLLIGSTLGIGYLASGIYRMGVLLYGKTPKPSEIFKMLKSSR
ncbi:MAG: hypothetical protein K0R15_30 [Clostridiales bacterium]|jgi:ABC-2 type transport system permease protein|nr:hypothetical protein [Clostridiales bacterium]